jgi:hypothetical protein
VREGARFLKTQEPSNVTDRKAAVVEITSSEVGPHLIEHCANHTESIGVRVRRARILHEARTMKATDFANVIRGLRAEMSVQDIAKRCGLSRQHLYKIAAGEVPRGRLTRPS